jgi:hypothetical protein
MRVTELVQQNHTTIELEPEQFQEGILYVSKRYEVAIHLCACGCKAKTVTPINEKTGWKFSEGPNGPTLSPSIYNNQTCGAHYFLTDGKIVWC